MPKLRLDQRQERFCELVGMCGYGESQAVREVWPELSPGSIGTKVARLSKDVLVQARIEEWNVKFMSEPRRIMKTYLRSIEIIGQNPDNRSLSSCFATLAKMAGMVEDKPSSTKLEITFKLEENDS